MKCPDAKKQHVALGHTWMWCPKIGVPQNGWFTMENPIKLDDLGVPPFSETPTYHIIVLLFCKLADVSMFSQTLKNKHHFFQEGNLHTFPHLSSHGSCRERLFPISETQGGQPGDFLWQKALLFQQRGWCFWIDYVEDVDPFCRWKKNPGKNPNPRNCLGFDTKPQVRVVYKLLGTVIIPIYNPCTIWYI